jgi:hypothetical protein
MNRICAQLEGPPYHVVADNGVQIPIPEHVTAPDGSRVDIWRNAEIEVGREGDYYEVVIRNPTVTSGDTRSLLAALGGGAANGSAKKFLKLRGTPSLPRWVLGQVAKGAVVAILGFFTPNSIAHEIFFRHRLADGSSVRYTVISQ